jgi:hypothetical protein
MILSFFKLMVTSARRKDPVRPAESPPPPAERPRSPGGINTPSGGRTPSTRRNHYPLRRKDPVRPAESPTPPAERPRPPGGIATPKCRHVPRSTPVRRGVGVSVDMPVEPLNVGGSAGGHSGGTPKCRWECRWTCRWKPLNAGLSPVARQCEGGWTARDNPPEEVIPATDLSPHLPLATTSTNPRSLLSSLQLPNVNGVRGWQS